MPRYRVMHLSSGETWEVEAAFADDACQVVGWETGDCQIIWLEHGPFAEIVPPKVALQVVPPKQGPIPICRDCNVTLTKEDNSEFWWSCPACDLMYHEREIQFFRRQDLPP